MEDEFINQVAQVVERHSRSYLLVEIKDAHFRKYQPTYNLADGTLSDCIIEFNDAIFDSLRLLIRYLRSLYAWNAAIQDCSEEVRGTVLADYVYPVFRLACDIPNTIKDQIIRGTVLPESVSRNDYRFIESFGSEGNGRRNWYDLFETARKRDERLSKIQFIVNNDLYNSAEAKHFRDLHGRALHEVSTTLMSGRRVTAQVFDGGIITSFEEPIELKTELDRLDGFRSALQNSYFAFNTYCESLNKL